MILGSWGQWWSRHRLGSGSTPYKLGAQPGYLHWCWWSISMTMMLWQPYSDVQRSTIYLNDSQMKFPWSVSVHIVIETVGESFLVCKLSFLGYCCWSRRSCHCCCWIWVIDIKCRGETVCWMCEGSINACVGGSVPERFCQLSLAFRCSQSTFMLIWYGIWTWMSLISLTVW